MHQFVMFQRLIRAYLRFNVRSAVPGLALKLSAAPPTTIVIACPAPLERILEQDCLETLLIPRAKIISRYKGTWKLLVSVSKCGLMPGKALEKPVADRRHMRWRHRWKERNTRLLWRRLRVHPYGMVRIKLGCGREMPPYMPIMPIEIE